MKVLVTVMPKAGVLDPQGKAIGHALAGLGFDGVGEVRAGKVIELELAETDAAAAEAGGRGDGPQAAGQYGDRELPRSRSPGEASWSSSPSFILARADRG